MRDSAGDRPLLIVATPERQAPIVWWSSAGYIAAAVRRLDEDSTLPFAEVWRRYRSIHDEAWCFSTREEASRWADGYLGPHYLTVRAATARIGDPPADLAGA